MNSEKMPLIILIWPVLEARAEILAINGKFKTQFWDYLTFKNLLDSTYFTRNSSFHSKEYNEWSYTNQDKSNQNNWLIQTPFWIIILLCCLYSKTKQIKNVFLGYWKFLTNEQFWTCDLFMTCFHKFWIYESSFLVYF